MKKIISNSPFFFIFLGVLGWLVYNSNFDKKIGRLDERYKAECLKEIDDFTISTDDIDKCRKEKWRERGLYKKYIKWMLDS